jgi:hypothetical protein
MKKVSVVVVAVVLVAVALTVFWLAFPNRTIVRNSSGENIASVRLVVQEHGGTKPFSRSMKSLDPEESMVLRHNLNDSKVKLTFFLDGKSQQYVEDHVDLWRGEGWLIDVQPAGKIESNYDYDSIWKD